MNTQLVQIPLAGDTPFSARLCALCDVQLAAGYRVVATFILQQDFYILFQKLQQPA